MKTQLQRVEIECALLRDHDFAIEHATRRQLLQQRLDQFGEIAVQRFLVAALYKHFFTVAKDERAKAVPFGFEDPRACFRQFADAFGKHRKNRRVYWELYNLFLPPIIRIDFCWASPPKRSGRRRFRGLSSPPHQGDLLSLEDPEPSSLRSFTTQRAPESAEAPLFYVPHASADPYPAPHQALSSVFYLRFWLNALRCTR